jgi:hypothetical protein
MLLVMVIDFLDQSLLNCACHFPVHETYSDMAWYLTCTDKIWGKFWWNLLGKKPVRQVEAKLKTYIAMLSLWEKQASSRIRLTLWKAEWDTKESRLFITPLGHQVKYLNPSLLLDLKLLEPTTSLLYKPVWFFSVTCNCNHHFWLYSLDLSK